MLFADLSPREQWIAHEAIRLLQCELRVNRRELERHTWFIRLSAIRQAAIENMAYQLGVTGVMRFRMMIRALRDGDHGNASLEMLDSKWATVDTPERAERVSQVMHTGKPIEWAGVPAGW
jgi:lysozyme